LSHPLDLNETRIMLNQLTFTSVKLPGVFMVTEIAFYGPVMLLAAFFWKPACQAMRQGGPAVPLLLLVGFVVSLHSRWRFCLSLYPMLVAFVVKAVEGHDWGRRQLVVFGALSLLVSKVWFTINTGPFTGRLHEFPDQGMFMNHGPWISPTMYAVQGAAYAFL